jgi:hypothetical protein
MNRLSFYLIIFLAVLFALLNGLEYWLYQSFEKVQWEQRVIQGRIAFAERQNSFNEALLRRLAIDSQRDPDLGELLKRHHVRIVFNTPQGTSRTGGTLSEGLGPISPEQAPAATTTPAPGATNNSSAPVHP